MMGVTTFVKMEMFSGRIVTGKVLNSRKEADAENQTLKASGSMYRWIGSLNELAKHEQEHQECKE